MTSARPARHAAGAMMEWESRETAEAWRQIRAQDAGVFTAATERMLDLAGVGTGDRIRDVAIESVAIRWRFPSVAATLDYYRLNVATLPRETADRLAGAVGEHVFAEIEQGLDRFRGPNGLEVPGEALIGVGAK